MTSNPALLTAFALSPLIYIAALALGRWLKNRHSVALGTMFHLFCISLAAYVPLRVMHLIEHPKGHPSPSDEVWHDVGIRIFASILIILTVLFALALLRRFYWQRWFLHRYGAEAPKLLQQVFSFTIFTVAVLIVLSKGHDVQVDAFLAGSGIAAVVLGFAMQETLANIVSGIALQIGKPFGTGDWLVVDTIRAEVIEVNWRSTRLRTNDDVYLDIPNKTIVTSTVTNLSYPTKTHANRIRVGFEYATPPNLIRDVLRRAAESVDGVVPTPPVKVFLRDFADSAIIYEIKYSLDDEGRFNDIEDAIRTNIWYECNRAGINIPFPQRVLHLDRSRPRRDTEPVRDALEKLELFTALTPQQRERLLENPPILRFGRGERIIKQGNEGCSMFVILRGGVEVLVAAPDGRETTVATLPAGEAFGEMCLLTGEKRTATIRAKDDTLIWEIRRADFQPLIQENDDIATRLSDMLARRKMETDNVLAALPPQAVAKQQEEIRQGLLGKMRALFKI